MFVFLLKKHNLLQNLLVQKNDTSVNHWDMHRKFRHFGNRARFCHFLHPYIGKRKLFHPRIDHSNRIPTITNASTHDKTRNFQPNHLGCTTILIFHGRSNPLRHRRRYQTNRFCTNPELQLLGRLDFGNIIVDEIRMIGSWADPTFATIFVVPPTIIS